VNGPGSIDAQRGPLSRGQRVATIDIGTNSVLLLVAEVVDSGEGVGLRPIDERATITRLGEGVDRTRVLGEDAKRRTLECLAAYGGAIRDHGVARAAAVGTSAMRDAGGGADFRDKAREVLGFEPAVISGDEEARLTFAGALSGISVTGVATVFDIGGGSTEIIRGDTSPRRIHAGTSLDIGSVRLTERHVRHDPPTSAEIEAIDADLARALQSAPEIAGTLVGVAGTVTTVAAIARGVDPYDASKIHGTVLELDEIAEVASRLAALPLAERVKLPGLSPKRADVIVAGARICLAVARSSGTGAVTVSDRGVRWGLAEELARG
jgi:exopolyphosphatase/guanosine-5'-triphosphate,3'-diphosphate pyrophosphatase